jgi:alpha-N-arabinofuranosidase
MKFFIKAALSCMVPALAAQVPPQHATIRVDPERVENHVSPRMYASFVEMMAEDVKWGLTAEMVHDRSFEEATDYLGLPALWRLEPDERNDNVGAIKFLQTSEEAYPKVNQATGAPEHSLRITLAPGDITDERRGISQGRLSVIAGQMYKGYFWIKLPKDGGYKGVVNVSLEEDNTDGAIYAQASVVNLQADWTKYSFTLVPSKTDRFAKLTFLFPGVGTLYLDQVSLERADAQGEVRPDSEAMIRGLHPSFMRWPGGNVAQDYHWQWGIGPRDLRPIWINTSWSNAPEPDDLGTDEYLALCERLDIAPSITVNVDGAGATAEEAAAWVEYVNGSPGSKYGAMRAANGHREPYNVKQWELGNEIFGKWVRGHVSGTEYAQAAVRYAKAMRAVDPTIQLIAVGEGIFPGSDDWNSAVLKIAGSEIQYLAVHDYNSVTQNASAPDPRAAMMGRPAGYEKNYKHMADLIRAEAPGRDIKVIVNEWNLFYGADVLQSIDGAVYAARMMNGFERDGDIVEASAISDLLNGWVGGVIQASRDRIYGTTQYYALKMYRDHLGTDRLFTTVTAPPLAPDIETLDAVATRSSDGSRLFIKMSNAGGQPLQTTMDVGTFRHLQTAEITLLRAANMKVRNSFAHPTAVAPIEKTFLCVKVCTVILPPSSVAVVTFSRAH